MTAYTATGRPDYLMKVESAEAVLGDTITLDLSALGDFTNLTHVFLGVQLLDISGDPIEDSAGSLAITIKTINTEWYEAPPTATIDATALATISWAGNTTAIKVVPTGLTDTVTWKVVATANRN